MTLAGVGSDPEQQPLNYLWQQISGRNVTINNSQNPQASFTAPNAAGTLEFSLTVTDDFGLTSFDNIIIKVIVTNTNADNQSGSSGGGSVYGLILLSVFWLGFRRVIVEKFSIQTH